MLTYIDLFAGAGGWETGLSELSWVCKGLYEWNESACNTLRFNFNSVVHCLDLKDYNKINFPKVNIVIGSPPCQGFSNEGKKNENDERNNLVWVYLEIVKKIDPDVWIFENVPGFKRSYKGSFFREFEHRLQFMGYHWNSFLLDSSDFGVPQYRKRFIAIGSKFKKPIQPKTTFSDLPNMFERGKQTLWDAISDLPQIGHGERTGIFDYAKEPQNDFQRLMRVQSQKISNHTTQNHSERVLEKIRKVPIGGNMSHIVGEFDENKTHYEGGYRRARKDLPSYTAYWTRGMTSIHPDLDRFLSPRECARIQSFPDNIEFKGSTIENYTQICNAVPPLMAKAICESVIENELCAKEKLNSNNNRSKSNAKK